MVGLMKAMIRSTLGASLAMLAMMLHFLKVEIGETTSALGQQLLVEIVCDFSNEATC
jgi:hypothetical protein